LFKQHKINYLQGAGFIQGPGIATAKDAAGQETELRWDRLILATGTRPSVIPNLAFDGQRVFSSNHALNLEEVPASIFILGETWLYRPACLFITN
jgi:dihydrolipoamide dehydrogenase